MANGLIVAAPATGSGKTLLTLGIGAALAARGARVAPAKSGPDYIDGALLARATGAMSVNLDAWAMTPERLREVASRHAGGADLLLVEGAMGLFDGAIDGRGSTGDVAAALELPVVLVLDAGRQGQSVAALAHGFASWRGEVRVAGLVLNGVASARHEAMLRAALLPLGLPLLGALPRDAALSLPTRHLGLVLPDEVATFDAVVAAASAAVAAHLDLDMLISLGAPLGGVGGVGRRLPPLGQHVAIARDAAFAFVYPHWLADWRAEGATLSFFSPLANEAPAMDADAIFLPGGYPELHAAQIAGATRFLDGLRAAAARDALIYGECGGFMVLGRALTDGAGTEHAMAGLLPHGTRIDQPRRVLGYRRLRHDGVLPFPAALLGHEFHYSSSEGEAGTPLFTAADALGEEIGLIGLRVGRVMGSYAHVIDAA